MQSNPRITAYRDKTPVIHPKAHVDVSVRIIGDVKIGEGVSVWPMAVLRADSAEIRIEGHAAILDLVLLEAPEAHPIVVEEGAIVSHGAIVHGAKIQTGALVGIGAIVLDGALVSSGAIVGAGSLITPGTQVPANSLVLGVPGKVVRKTTLQERQSILNQLEEIHEKMWQLKSF
jgi:carbonic anhydrase/acetyltransferase-like protein (isoleucine patch superfamily)